jgi:hypothetical protein
MAKEYVGSFKEKSINFNGNTFEVIEASFKQKDLERMLEIAQKSKGYANISIAKKQEPDQYGNTHYATMYVKDSK